MEAVLVDFEDSFTYNIAQHLYDYGITYRIVSWRNYSPHFAKNSKVVVILGPGPGVVFDYQEIFSKVVAGLERNVHLGICLGHHLLGVIHGFKLYRDHPVHGQAVDVEIPHWSCFAPEHRGKRTSVQRYNSWSIKGSPKGQGRLSGDGMFLLGHNFLSYQFHPESIGTACPEIFFNSAFEFAYK